MGEILARYKRPLFTFLLSSCRDRARAEDLLQECFLRLVTKQDSFEGSSRLKTWLYAVARNLCIDDARRQKHRRHVSLDAERPSGDTLIERTEGNNVEADRAIASQEIGLRIGAAVAELPQEQREVFLLRQVEQLSFKEIGDITGVGENTAKTRMRYAFERLQVALADFVHAEERS